MNTNRARTSTGANQASCEQHMITVLTATYNREHTLPRLFESLCAQTDQAFEWLLIDDGSTDGTEVLVGRFKLQERFPVRYVRQQNGGKHVAINTGACRALGKWTLIVDSDDALTPDAIAVLRGATANIAGKDLVGVCYRKAEFDGAVVGEKSLPDAPIYLHPSEAASIFKGDLAYAFCTAALRAHPFPIIPTERFVPELYIWNAIGDMGNILFFPRKAIYLCEYLPDGYSANFQRNLERNPNGFAIFYRSQFFRERSMKGRLKCVVRVLQCIIYAARNRL